MSAAPGTFAQYWSAVATGDAAAAVALAQREHDNGVPVSQLLDSLVCAAQAEVGRLWAANEWNVAHEHRATSVSEEVVAALSARIPAKAGGRNVVVTCADGEWHSLPSRVLGAALREAGFRVTYLGASVPTRHFAHLLHDIGPDATAISCALAVRLFDAREMIEVSRAAGVPVLVGGPGFGPQGRWATAVGADAWAPNASAAVELLASGRLPAFTSPAPPVTAPDEVIATLRAAVPRVVDGSVRRMSAALPDVARYDRHQLQRTEEDVAHIVHFLCAALYVDDVELFTSFVGWLAEILVARAVPARTVAAGLRVVGQAVADECGDLPRAQQFLAAGIAAVPG